MAKENHPYDEELAAEVCKRIATSTDSLLKVCSDPDMPSAKSVYTWLMRYPAFRETYYAAKKDQVQLYAEETLAIADETPMVMIPGKHGDYEAIDAAGVQRNKLRCNMRQWHAAKLDRRYGDKVQQEVSGANGGPVVFTVERMGKQDE